MAYQSDASDGIRKMVPGPLQDFFVTSNGRLRIGA